MPVLLYVADVVRFVTVASQVYVELWSVIAKL